MVYQETLHQIYAALCEKGYNPIGQLEDFILSDDPTHITPYKNARRLSGRIDRDALLAELLQFYLDSTQPSAS